MYVRMLYCKEERFVLLRKMCNFKAKTMLVQFAISHYVANKPSTYLILGIIIFFMNFLTRGSNLGLHVVNADIGLLNQEKVFVLNTEKYMKIAREYVLHDQVFKF